MNTDLTFITNEPPAFAEASAVGSTKSAYGRTKSAGKEANLLDRFRV